MRWLPREFLQFTSVWVCLLGGGSALACANDIVEPPPSEPIERKPAVNTVTVWADFSPDTVSPGDTARITVRAVPSHPSHVSWVELRFGGLFNDTLRVDSLPAGPGDVTLYAALAIPRGQLEGSLSLKAAASVLGWEDTTTAVLTVLDRTPPLIAIEMPSYVDPGDTVQIRLQSSDNGALTQARLLVTGAATLADSELAFGELTYAGLFDVAVPDTAHLGDSVQVMAIATDWKGIRDTATAAVQVVDRTPPAVSASAILDRPDSAWGSYPAWFTGDTLALVAHVTDHSSIASLRVLLSTSQVWGNVVTLDTFQLSGADITLGMKVPVRPEWHGLYGPLLLVAVDEFGNASTWTGGNLTFFDGRRFPTTVIAVSPGAVSDVAFDEPRNLLFLAQPDSNRIAVFSLATETYENPVATPHAPSGLDLSVSGDSLVMAFAGTPHIGVIDLTSTPWTVDTVRLALLDGVRLAPAGIRITADGVAWLSLAGTDVRDSTVYAFDLASSSNDLLAISFEESIVVRSRDRSTVGVGFPSENTIVLRRIGDPSFVEPTGVNYEDGPLFAIHPLGEYAVAAHTLIDHDFYGSELPHTFPAGVGTFSVDGSEIFATHAHIPGVEIWAIPDGERVDGVFLGHRVGGIVPMPDGAHVVLLDQEGAPRWIVDLIN